MSSPSQIVAGLNAIQTEIGRELENLGFTKKGRTFRRETDRDMLQLVALQAGPFEIGPPLPAPVSHLRPDYYGKFTINLGVFVPEIHERTNPPVALSRTINDAYCSIRTRLAHITEGKDLWWPILEGSKDDIDDLIAQILHVGVPFLDRFGTREKIIRDWIAFNDGPERLTKVARLDVAMILLARGEGVLAKSLFKSHLRKSEAEGDEPFHKNHRRYIRELADKLSLGELD